MNSTQASYFILAAYFYSGVFRPALFLVVLVLYVLIVVANVSLIVLICMNRSLHEPMFMFLCSLFVNELYGSSGLFPFLLFQILADVHQVSPPLCFLQIFYVFSYGNVEFYNLAVMSYDRYLAICHPLTYNSRMTPKKVAVLTALLWVFPFLVVAFMISLSKPLRLCGNIIDKVYCDNYSIVKLACSDTTVNNVYGIIYSILSIIGISVLIFYTYIRILRVCFSGSAEMRWKAMSTCVPHLISLFNFGFGAIFEIMQSRFNMSTVPLALRVFLSLYFLVCQPLFNPFLYGLMLTKIRSSFRRLVFWKNVTF